MFQFKRFTVSDANCGMKIGTDSVLLGAWADVTSAKEVIDLGAGCGLLSLMVAQRNPSCSIAAIEIDSNACADARENFDAYLENAKLTLVNADALVFQPVKAPDLIICNPPYFATALKSPDAARAMARHGSGLLPSTAIEIASKWLSSEGSLAMVTPADGASDLLFAAEMARLRLRRQCFVSPSEGKRPNRVLWQFSRIDGPCRKKNLSIFDSKGQYSPEYRELTKDFYLNI